MVRYERFGLGATWNEEYGSADDPEQLAWLLAYSPYHHVVDGMRLSGGAVHGVRRRHPGRSAARAQDVRGAAARDVVGDRPVLIRREKDVGHGARALSRSVDLSADTLAFTARWTGLSLEP